jgi:hypothetical protein
MNNIVKIILGLNIAAGGAGIFFGITKSGKVGELKSAKDTAVTDAQTAKSKEREFEKKWKTAAEDASTKAGNIAQLDSQLKGLQGGAAQAQLQIDQANSSAQIAQAAAAKANSDLIQAQQMANQVPALKGQIAAYENLGIPQDIKDGLDRLAKLEAAATSGSKKKKTRETAGGEVGTIQNHDPQLGFYVINVGSDNGVNKGDKYTIFRAGRAIGKIEISRAQPTVSIAVYQKGFPKPAAPFKSGDKVMKIN